MKFYSFIEYVAMCVLKDYKGFFIKYYYTSNRRIGKHSDLGVTEAEQD